MSATPALIREHYDSLAFVYSRFWGDHIHHGLFENGSESANRAQELMVDYCCSLVQPRPGERVLDVGCGHGGTAVRLAERGCQVVGITISEKQLRIALEKSAKAGARDAIRFVVQDADQFEFPRTDFDLVWTMESSEHFFDKQRYLKQVAAALKPGGRLLLAAWTGSMSAPTVSAVAEAFLCPHLWTAEQYCATAQAAGLQVEHRVDLTAKVINTWEICRERARAARPIWGMLPRGARNLVAGIDVIRDAYSRGDLTYTVLSATKY